MGRAVTAHDGDRVIDAGLLGVVKVADVGFDALDQSADAGDFLVGAGGIGAGPVVDPDSQQPTRIGTAGEGIDDPQGRPCSFPARAGSERAEAGNTGARGRVDASSLHGAGNTLVSQSRTV